MLSFFLPGFVDLSPSGLTGPAPDVIEREAGRDKNTELQLKMSPSHWLCWPEPEGPRQLLCLLVIARKLSFLVSSVPSADLSTHVGLAIVQRDVDWARRVGMATVICHNRAASVPSSETGQKTLKAGA